MRLRSLHALLGDESGSTVIETAFVVPILTLLSVGTFQISKVVSRQVELQQAVAEAAQIALASPPDTADERTTIKGIIKASTGLGDGNVTITNEYRCDATATRVLTNTCTSGQAVTTYLKIVVTDTYTPLWNDYGVGSPISFNVTRLVIVA